MEYSAPQIAGRDAPYRSAIREHLKGHTQGLEDLAIEMLARGLSVRDIEDAFKDENGRLLLSKTAVSQLGERLWEDYQAFAQRDSASTRSPVVSTASHEYTPPPSSANQSPRPGAYRSGPAPGMAASSDGGMKEMRTRAIISSRTWKRQVADTAGRGLGRAPPAPSKAIDVASRGTAQRLGACSSSATWCVEAPEDVSAEFKVRVAAPIKPEPSDRAPLSPPASSPTIAARMIARSPASWTTLKPVLRTCDSR